MIRFVRGAEGRLGGESVGEGLMRWPAIASGPGVTGMPPRSRGGIMPPSPTH